MTDDATEQDPIAARAVRLSADRGADFAWRFEPDEPGAVDPDERARAWRAVLLADLL